MNEPNIKGIENAKKMYFAGFGMDKAKPGTRANTLKNSNIRIEKPVLASQKPVCIGNKNAIAK